ncbi:hypothetical protein DAPPUDRAFT_97780 [Daphnia pulex]|uniref:Uncharacterized protein n=1 Tax=Daphnia pulex TaxID=6669 RepID=E9G198_DAPPU|nr:hypothetical protein DAPPUDRAFT_97780 [Daphnia pulex]|eukprot:EFX86633.1 hypothetical protein DAPPUDRAFT_97780 [Daphnia pulex]
MEKQACQLLLELKDKVLNLKQSHTGFSPNHQDILDKMLLELRCGVCSELIVFEEQSNRRKFEKEHQELHRNLLAAGLRTPEYNNSFYRITDCGLVLGEMQIEELPSIAQRQFPGCYPPAAVSSSTMVASIVRNLTRNPLLSRERR